MKRFLAAILVACALPAAAFAQEVEPLKIVSGDATHDFQVELADSPEETERGLMNRAEMAKDHGMIFDFGDPRPVSMWMKNTLIPLDMLFIDEEGTVLAIAHNARPHSLRLVGPGFAVKSVLEINGGLSKELGLKPGDVVQHGIFDNLAQ